MHAKGDIINVFFILVLARSLKNDAMQIYWDLQLHACANYTLELSPLIGVLETPVW